MDHNLTPAAPSRLPASVMPPAPDVMPPALNPYALLIQRARSEATRRTYAQNLTRFFKDEFGRAPDAATGPPSAEAVRAFLALDAPDMAMRLAGHRQRMRDAGAAASSINVRLASVRALVDTAHKFRLCAFGSAGLVQGAKAQSYRDTRGPGLENVRRLLALPDRTTLRGRRDYALLRLLADNGPRRSEVCGMGVADFRPAERRIAVLGKGRDDKEFLTLHPGTVRAIGEYLSAAGHTDGALFRSCAHRASARGGPLTADGLDDVVRTYGARIGLKLSPHKFRHFAITALLDAGADIRKVQKFSRHKKLETLMIYDDNRTDHQGEMTTLLGDLLDS